MEKEKGSGGAQTKADLAWNKPVHASTGKALAKYVTDGNRETVWRGDYYPSYLDIDLGKNYYLDTVEIHTPKQGSLQYTLYASINGRDFGRVTEYSLTEEVCSLKGNEARIIRVYAEYDAASPTPVIGEVRVFGRESQTKLQERPPVEVEDYETSGYHVPVTDADTYSEVYGIVERRLGAAYQDWFTLELAKNPVCGHRYDYFELESRDGKVHVKGNNGVSLAFGINYYLKYYCGVSLSQVGDQAQMPEEIVLPDRPVRRETKAKIRYFNNYCTLSYSMSFWGREEWRRELDFLALNGVNVVLDAAAQEEVWRRFLGALGYSHEDIRDFIAGPAYYAWAYMANLSGFGGPVHDSWFEKRTALARENHLIMQRLGMAPVLQGYCGMVPVDIRDYDPDAEVIEQGSWCSFRRPDMLKTTSPSFKRYAKLFYQAQREVYGDMSHYYATDPFHEGGNTGGMSARAVSREVLSAMLRSDPEAVWVIQSWQGNPGSELLEGIGDVKNGKAHALILDLYAEKTPHYDEGNRNNASYGYQKEFNGTPWVYCMLNNFGGRLGLHGHLDNMAKKIPDVFRNCRHIAGIGAAPEASANNPVLYDFLFEAVWQEDASANLPERNLEEWLEGYVFRRYGARSEAAYEAWKILKETVYKSALNNLGQGAPESVVNARPALEIQAASAWGNAVISYDPKELERAAGLLLKDYEKLKGSVGYRYDVTTVIQQVLSNKAGECQKELAEAFQKRETEKFALYGEKFLHIIDEMEAVTGSNEYYLLERWIKQARALAENTDDFTKMLFEFNAKALITTWGSYHQAETGQLHDYSNRQWAGLIKDFYKNRWERWINAKKKELETGREGEKIDWFAWEWEWVRSHTMPLLSNS